MTLAMDSGNVSLFKHTRQYSQSRVVVREDKFKEKLYAVA